LFISYPDFGFVNSVCAAKSPPALVAGGLLNLSICLALLTSSHSSPPAWRSHDDGGDGDGGGFASD
jgi:hypothetical protein